MIWGALLGALGEELFFRGLLWSTITDLTGRLAPRSEAPREQESAPPVPLDDVDAAPAAGPGRPPVSLRDRILGVVLDGGIATVLCALLFGWMHKDLPGGVGIVRFWSTTFLGLASGVVRQVTGSVLCCILLHLLYNTLAIGIGQRWFAAREEPVVEGIPNLLLLVAVLGAAALGVIAFARALRARRSQSVF